MAEENTQMDTAQAEYATFEEKVRRTVYIDNLSPQATESVVKNALNQFGNVNFVTFIPNYLNPKNMPCCALVEMDNAKQAKSIIKEMATHPFMICGMPRPARARAAEVHMFGDRPVKPGRKIQCRWLDQSDPDFAVAKRLKQLAQKHAAEESFMLKRQLEEEEKLAKQQAIALKANYRKFETIDGVLVDGAARRLGSRYDIHIRDN